VLESIAAFVFIYSVETYSVQILFSNCSFSTYMNWNELTLGETYL
jgi:hypothetical protein